MATIAAFTVALLAVVPLVALMNWLRTDARRQYYRLRRAPLRVPVALEIHHHGRLARAYSDWSAWSADHGELGTVQHRIR